MNPLSRRRFLADLAFAGGSLSLLAGLAAALLPQNGTASPTPSPTTTPGSAPSRPKDAPCPGKAPTKSPRIPDLKGRLRAVPPNPKGQP